MKKRFKNGSFVLTIEELQGNTFSLEMLKGVDRCWRMSVTKNESETAKEVFRRVGYFENNRTGLKAIKIGEDHYKATNSRRYG